MTSEDRLSHTRGQFSPSCSVIVCTRNRPAQLERCLATLAELDYPDYEVLVADNAPSDSRSREVAQRWGVRYIVEPVRGLSRARNRGALACESEVVAYLDDDAVADRKWLSILVSDFADPLVAAVTGSILPLVADTQTATWWTSPSERSRRVVDRHTSGWFKSANFGELGDGSNMAFRRSTFDIWPGFDERLGRGTILGGGEEHYAFFTLIERGFRVVHNPDAIVRHPDPSSPEELRRRHLHVASVAGAYVTRLAVEHPSSRSELARYLIGRVRAMLRMRRERAAPAMRSAVPRWRTLLGFLHGPGIYLRSRMTRDPLPIEAAPPDGNEKGIPSPVSLRDETCRLES